MTARSRVIMEMTGEEAKLLQSYQRAIQQNKEFKRELQGLRRAGRETQDGFSRFGKTMKDAFSPRSVLNLAGTIAGVAGGVSLAGALSKVVAVAGEARQEVQGIADGIKETYEGARALWQVAEGRRGYAELRKETRQSMADEGISRAQAQDLLFNLTSLGQREALPAIVKSARFMDPGTASQYLTTVASKTNFGAAAGNPEQVLSGLIAGAGVSKFNTEQTAEWVTRVAPVLQDLGASQAEMLAVGASISEATPNAETLATYLRAAQKDLANWRDEAIAAAAAAERPAAPVAPAFAPGAGEDLTEYQKTYEGRWARYQQQLADYEAEHGAVTTRAPEAPEYAPPERPKSIRPEAHMAYKEDLAEYEEQYTKDLTAYRQDRQRYEAELRRAAEDRAKKLKIAAAAEEATGVIGIFETMRQVDPEAYQAATAANVRFKSFAAAFEDGLDKAKQLIPVIDQAIQTGAQYTEKTATPRVLTEQEQRNRAEQMRTIALEERAQAENRLRTMIDYNKAFAEFTGQSLTATKGWEKAIETGATVAGAERMTREAGEQLVEAIYERQPELYRRHLAAAVPVDTYRTAGGMGSMATTQIDARIAEMTPAIAQAIGNALRELTGRRIEADYQEDIGGKLDRVADKLDTLNETVKTAGGPEGFTPKPLQDME